MRFTEPMPHNPWPHDMVIRVDDAPQHLTVLLFIRQAWGIAAGADVPPLAPVPEGGASQLPLVPGRNVWEARWHRAWERAWDWYAVQEPDPTVRPTPGYIREFSQPGRDLNPLIPPFWQSEYGWEGIDGDAYSDWQRHCSPQAYGQRPRNAADSPEPQSLTALISAWKKGLDTVVVFRMRGSLPAGSPPATSPCPRRRAMTLRATRRRWIPGPGCPNRKHSPRKQARVLGEFRLHSGAPPSGPSASDQPSTWLG